MLKKLTATDVTFGAAVGLKKLQSGIIKFIEPVFGGI